MNRRRRDWRQTNGRAAKRTQLLVGKSWRPGGESVEQMLVRAGSGEAKSEEERRRRGGARRADVAAGDGRVGGAPPPAAESAPPPSAPTTAAPPPAAESGRCSEG